MADVEALERGQKLWNCARQLIKEVATVRSMDVLLPVMERESKQTREMQATGGGAAGSAGGRTPGALGTAPPSAPMLVQNVAEKNKV